MPKKPAARPDCHRPHMRAASQPNLRLPLEIVGVVAEFLLGSYHFGTLAKLNRTCKAIRAETLPVLYETLTWDNEFHAKQREWWIEVFQGNTGQTGIKFPEGWKWVKFLFLETKQKPSFDKLTMSGFTLQQIFPAMKFLISRDLEGAYVKSSGMTLYTAKLEVFAQTQKSVFFFSSLFGTPSKPSILDTPLRIKKDSFRGKMPLTTKFAHQENLEGVTFFPDACLKRAGRTKLDLGLKDDHYFNGTHLFVTWEPVVTDANNALIQETLEELILLLPKDLTRMMFYCKSDVAFMKRLYNAVRKTITKTFRCVYMHPSSHMTPEDWISMVTMFAKLFAANWEHVKPYTTPDVHFFSILFGADVPNPDAPGRTTRYTIEGGLWAGKTGFELVGHRSTKIPGQEGRWYRFQMHYETFAGAENRKALLASLNTMDQLSTVYKPISVPKRETIDLSRA